MKKGFDSFPPDYIGNGMDGVQVYPAKGAIVRSGKRLFRITGASEITDARGKKYHLDPQAKRKHG